MKSIDFDYVVIGAGAVGTAAAYHLARRGGQVALLEQFELGHARGSSHGPSRIIRYSYADFAYAKRMGAAFETWRALEADAGEAVYTRTGGMSLCRPELSYVREVTRCLEELKVGHRRMTGRDLKRAYPAFDVPDDEEVVFEPAIGILAAGRIVRLQVELATRHGGDRFAMHDRTPVLGLDLDGERPVVKTANGSLTAKRLIVTAGAWMRRLIPDFPVALEVVRQSVVHLRPSPGEAYAIGRFPVFIRKLEAESEAFYGLPDYAGQGVKVALHHGGEPIAPDTMGRDVPARDLERVRACLADCLPGLVSAPIDRAESCLYTVAPGEQFTVGPYPGRPDVLVASACSGHGFKFSNLVGRVLAEQAMDGGTSLDVRDWTPRMTKA